MAQADGDNPRIAFTRVRESLKDEDHEYRVTVTTTDWGTEFTRTSIDPDEETTH